MALYHQPRPFFPFFFFPFPITAPPPAYQFDRRDLD
jgi:hypothetical protein